MGSVARRRGATIVAGTASAAASLVTVALRMRTAERAVRCVAKASCGLIAPGWTAAPHVMHCSRSLERAHRKRPHRASQGPLQTLRRVPRILCLRMALAVRCQRDGTAVVTVTAAVSTDTAAPRTPTVERAVRYARRMRSAGRHRIFIHRTCSIRRLSSGSAFHKRPRRPAPALLHRLSPPRVPSHQRPLRP